MPQILLIEDDEVLNFVMMKFLRTYEVVLKTDGQEAMGWLREGNTPSLIISDINMPNLSGIEFLKEKNNYEVLKNIPVVILSGFEDEARKSECIRLGASAYALKPIEREHLLSLVESILKK